MDPRRTVVASQPGVAAAAAELPLTASAVDRVVAGVFAAVALSPSVLFGPVQILLGGGGLGTFAIDGRVLQPGKGAPRPRGFTADDAIPDAAWVAVPTLPGALSAALALVRTTTLGRVAGPAIELAKERSAGRAKLLKLLGRRGGASFTDRELVDELTNAFGRTAGGLLTAEDLAEPDIQASPATITTLPGTKGSLARVPWFEPREPSADSVVHVVACGDTRGRFVVACYEDARDGVALESLDLVIPRLAEPVRRGEVRVRPGAARLASAPIALALAEGTALAAAGRAGRDADDGLESVAKSVVASEWTGATGVVGVVRSREGAAPL
ncbi:MAG: hypothetical protein U0235_19485 [Polyangiaceae bacterium]